MRRARRAQEIWQRRANPDEGLRERKRRLTRQLISDAATVMFATRGFDNVRVAEIADSVVGSQRRRSTTTSPPRSRWSSTRPTRRIERVARALRERRPNESLTEAVVRALKEDGERFAELPEELSPGFRSSAR